MKIEAEDYLPEGSSLGPYVIEAAIGAGTFGVVYRVRKGRLGKLKALKVLKATPARDELIVARFEREARALAAIQDDHVVAVEDVGVLDGHHFIEMELLEGGSLTRALKARPRWSLADALDVVLPVASGLHAAHTSPMRVVHRDLKPDNIFLAVSPGGVVVPKVVDFGVAHAPEEAHEVTTSGQAIGTPSYMSPEQVLAQRGIDGRADQWALAVILFVMLTGRRPFYTPEGAIQTGYLIVTADTPSLRDDGVVIDPWAEAAMRKALSKRAQDRFGSMREFGLALAPYARHETRARFEARWPVGPEEESTVRAPETPLPRLVTAPTLVAPPKAPTDDERVTPPRKARDSEGGAASANAGAKREEGGEAKKGHGGEADGEVAVEPTVRAVEAPTQPQERFEVVTVPRIDAPPEERPRPPTVALLGPPKPPIDFAPKEVATDAGPEQKSGVDSGAAVVVPLLPNERRRSLAWGFGALAVAAAMAFVAGLVLGTDDTSTRPVALEPAHDASPRAVMAASALPVAAGDASVATTAQRTPDASGHVAPAVVGEAARPVVSRDAAAPARLPAMVARSTATATAVSRDAGVARSAQPGPDVPTPYDEPVQAPGVVSPPALESETQPTTQTSPQIQAVQTEDGRTRFRRGLPRPPTQNTAPVDAGGQ